jgi:hypothetical protein
MQCGHPIHIACLSLMVTPDTPKKSVKCPICKKSGNDVDSMEEKLRETPKGAEFSPSFDPTATSSGLDRSGGDDVDGEVADGVIDELVDELMGDVDVEDIVEAAIELGDPCEGDVAGGGGDDGAKTHPKSMPKAKPAPKAKSKATAKAKAKAHGGDGGSDVGGKPKAKGKPKSKTATTSGTGEESMPAPAPKPRGSKRASADDGVAAPKTRAKPKAKASPEAKAAGATAKAAAATMAKPKAKAVIAMLRPGQADQASAAADGDVVDGAVAVPTPSGGDGDGSAAALVPVEGPPEEPEPAHLPTVMGDKVLCDQCKRYSDFSRSRVLSKGAGRWQCGTCGSKTTSLRRKLGGWPTPSFSLLSEDLGPVEFTTVIPQMVSQRTPLYNRFWPTQHTAHRCSRKGLADGARASSHCSDGSTANSAP